MTEHTFEWIRVPTGQTDLKPCVPPADAAVLGLPLPTSHRTFLAQFGYGLFGGLVHVFPWCPEYCDHVGRRASQLRAMFQQYLELEIAELEPDGSPAELLASVPFGISINGDTLCWDPAARIDGEPEVIVVAPKVLAYERTGRDFASFLRSLTSPAGARFLMGPSATALPPTFVPDSYFAKWLHERA